MQSKLNPNETSGFFFYGGRNSDKNNCDKSAIQWIILYSELIQNLRKSKNIPSKSWTGLCSFCDLYVIVC